MPLSGQQIAGGMCMRGGIYTEEKCALCGAQMKDNGRDAVCCPDHKGQRARTFYVRFGRPIQKRFTDYQLASRFLTGLRFKVDESTFDVRDYQSSNPLAFSNLTGKYLAVKEQTVKPGTFTHIKRDLGNAGAWFASINVKEIQYGELEDFLLGQKAISSKTRHNIKANLHAFFVWLVKRKIIRKDQMPDFPELSFELGWRKIIDIHTQGQILDKIKEMTWSTNPRAYIAVLWLSTYLPMRPHEIRNILEEDIDLERGIVTIHQHKTMRHTKAPKEIALIPEDVELLRSLPRGFPKLHFFRRDKGGGGKFRGTPFGKHFLYDLWKKACKDLNIEGVDLYGGTRHSTAQFLRKYKSPEEIRRVSMHTTSKASERYLQVQADEFMEAFTIIRRRSNDNVLQIKNVAPPEHQKGKTDS